MRARGEKTVVIVFMTSRVGTRDLRAMVGQSGTGAERRAVCVPRANAHRGPRWLGRGERAEPAGRTTRRGNAHASAVIESGKKAAARGPRKVLLPQVRVRSRRPEGRESPQRRSHEVQ